MSLIEILDDRVTAAVVAATGTIIGALVQLRIAWRKEVSERARGVPLNKKSRRGPVLAIFLLVFAAGVGGFALSQYFVGQTVRDSAALQSQLQAQLAQIGAAAARLEQASLAGREGASGAGASSPPVAGASVGPCPALAGEATPPAPAPAAPSAAAAPVAAPGAQAVPAVAGDHLPRSVVSDDPH